MGDERPVDRHEPKTLTLREQHPVERIASLGIGLDGGERVTLIDGDDFNAQAVKKLG